MGRLDAERVRAELTIDTVLDRYGLAPRRDRRHVRAPCPLCGCASREPFCVDQQRGLWTCHHCGAGGDALALVAALAQMDVRRDFGRVLELAAELAGIDTTHATDTSEVERQATERRRRAAELAEHDRQERAKAEGRAAELWRRLPSCSRDGRAYLASRGLETTAFVVKMQGRALAIPLFRDGSIVNVVSREPVAGAKPRGLRNCGTDGSFGRLSDKAGPIVIVEGWADWLSAVVIWPDRCCLGAHGADRLPYVAEVAAPLAREHGAVLVPHPDRAGRRGAQAARDVLLRAGVAPPLILRADTGSGDLNDWMMSR